MLNDMIAKFEQEAEEDATESANWDEEIATTEAEKEEIHDEIECCVPLQKKR